MSASIGDRQRVLDDAALLMLSSVALAVGIPWFTRSAGIELAPIAWALFAYGTAYLALSRATELMRGPAAQAAALAGLHAISIVFVAYLWHHAGNVQNPAFLLVFAIPVAAAGCVLPGGQTFVLCLLAMACATIVAVVDAPQLGWYLVQLGLPAFDLPGVGAASGPRPFPGLELPAAYLFLLLVTFAVVIGAVAISSHLVMGLVSGLATRLAASGDALRRASSLATEVIGAAPHPMVLVHADDFRVAEASRSFLDRAGLLPENAIGSGLFGLVEFARPEELRDLAAGAGGEIAVAAYRAMEATHVARVHVAIVHHGSSRYACISMEDVLDRLGQRAALDRASDALLVLGTDLRVQAFNRAALQLLPHVATGMDASLALRGPEAASSWWMLGPRSHRERTIVLEGQTCAVECTAVAAVGLRDRMTVVRARPLP